MARHPARLPKRLLRIRLAALLLAVAPATAAPPDPLPEGLWPLDPVPAVHARFDPPGHRYGAGHRGVDLVGRPAQAVRSAMAGTVSFAGTLAGRGVVSVTHSDGTRTTYQPLLAEVAVGDVVDAGQRIGWLTTHGSHCAPATCLHWGWRDGEDYLDPLLLVGRPRVRLLPLWSPAPVTVGARAEPAASGPRVGLPVGGAQPVGADVGVQLGGRQ